MQYETNSNAGGTAINSFNQSAVSVISTAKYKHASRQTQKDPLNLKDKAGLVFVVMVLLMLQFLEKIKLLK